MLTEFVVNRYETTGTNTYSYELGFSIRATLDKAAADEHPETEGWLIKDMADRLVRELMAARQNGISVRLKR